MLTFGSNASPDLYTSLSGFSSTTPGYGTGVNLQRNIAGSPLGVDGFGLGTDPFNLSNPLGTGVGAGTTGIKFSDLFGETGKTALGGIGVLGNLYMGMQNYGLAKDAFNLQKENYERNYQAQRQLTNSRLEDRQRARVAVNPNNESVDSYMERNRVL